MDLKGIWFEGADKMMIRYNDGNCLNIVMKPSVAKKKAHTWADHLIPGLIFL